MSDGEFAPKSELFFLFRLLVHSNKNVLSTLYFEVHLDEDGCHNYIVANVMSRTDGISTSATSVSKLQ